MSTQCVPLGGAYVWSYEQTRWSPRIKCAVLRAASRPQRVRTQVPVSRRRGIRRESTMWKKRKENGRQGEVSRQPRGYIALPGCPRGLTFSSARKFLHGCAPEDYEATPASRSFYRARVRASALLSGYKRARGKYVSSSIRMRKLNLKTCIYVRYYRHDLRDLENKNILKALCTLRRFVTHSKFYKDKD